MAEWSALRKPTIGMVRELARAHLGAPSRELVARWTLRARGLVDITGRLTAAGEVALSAAYRQHERHHPNG